MIHEDQIFVVNVVVTNLTQKMVAMSVINRLTSVVAGLSTIANIRKYKRFHKGHHFMPMVVMRCMRHLSVIWIVSSRSVLVFSTITDQEVIYPCSFVFRF